MTQVKSALAEAVIKLITLSESNRNLFDCEGGTICLSVTCCALA